MKKLGIGIGICLAVAVQSQAFLVVDINATNVTDASTYTDVLSSGLNKKVDTSAADLLSTAAGYNSPNLYGGSERNDYIGIAGVSDNGGSGWRVRLNNSSAGNWVAATHLFKTDAVSFNAANDTLNAVEINTAQEQRMGSAVVRFVVENAGSFYISESSGNLLTGGSGTLNTSFTLDALDSTTDWFDYDPESTGVDSGIGTTALTITPDFDDIDFIGFYVRADGDDTDTTGINFGVREFTATAIPEPATLGLIAAFGGVIMFVRRRFMV